MQKKIIITKSRLLATEGRWKWPNIITLISDLRHNADATLLVQLNSLQQH